MQKQTTAFLNNHSSNSFGRISIALLISTFILAGCGGGEPKCDEPAPRNFTPDQISALTPATIDKVTDDEIIGMGVNIKLLANNVLSKLKTGTIHLNPFCPSHKSQILAIQPSQIDALAPSQIRFLGSSDNGIAKIDKLNDDAWAMLVSKPIQVAAFTIDEMESISTNHFIDIDTNIKYLSNPVIGSLKPTFIASFTTHTSKINSITANQIAVLTPAQIRILGATPTGVSQINFLNDSAWKKLFEDPVQVAAITSQEMLTFSSPRIPMMGENIKFLTDEVFSVIKYTFNATLTNLKSQVASISPSQIKVLSPNQIAIIAAFNHGIGIAYLDVYSFGALTPAQVAILTGANVDNVTPSQLAALSVESLAAFTPSAIASLTAQQKTLLTAPQHIACGC